MKVWMARLVPEIERLSTTTQMSSSNEDSLLVPQTLPETAFNHGSLESVDAQTRSMVEHLVSWTPHALVVTKMADDGGSPIEYCNDHFCIQTGYAADEVIGRDISFLLADDRDQRGIKNMRDAIKEGTR